MAKSENRTYVDPEAVRSTADRIGVLMDDLQTFYTLGGLETKAGNFSTASWLQNLVHNRQQGIVQHATDVKMVAGDIKDGLHQIVSTFEKTDKDNADSLERSLYHGVNEMRIDAYKSSEGAKGSGEPAHPNGQA
ncbi:hypothetical protein JNUCC0626_48010 [Lentzea sp. JNUCC 0626]|uniref:hypothetical protein n=1 Tax=Lentzea sp. JNUCC 0626 TaxID=3367513 RepID=UPI00374A53CC